MDLSGPNPVHLQGDRLQTSSVPLFLIHDGGGTIYPYFGIGSLGRDVYGIFNLQLASASKGRIDIVEMAGDYCRRVKEASEDRNILLGGKPPSLHHWG